MTNDLEELNNKIQHLELVLSYADKTKKIDQLVKDHSSKLIANKTLRKKIDEQKFLITDLKQECFQCLSRKRHISDTVNSDTVNLVNNDNTVTVNSDTVKTVNSDTVKTVNNE